MSKFIIEGGHPLKGSVSVSGCKNAALPIMVAALLSDEPSTIHNIPDVSDVQTIGDIINSLGAKAEKLDKHTWRISGKGLRNYRINPELARKLRSSILLISPLIARLNQAVFPHPGGCVIGKRPIDTHMEALRALGVSIESHENEYVAKVRRLHGAIMFLDEVSVSGTENALMLAVLTPGETVIKPAACEPHVIDLANFLRAMGARIEGEGTHEIRVWGIKQLNGVTDYSVIPDNIEAGTFAIAAVASKGEVIINNIESEHMDPIVHKLRQMGAEVVVNNHTMLAKYKGPLKSARIQVDTWPRLPSDLQAPFGLLATQAQGTSLVHEWMYERRLAYTDELVHMGANITICDPHRALITGPTKLYAARITSPDLRAGITLVIAAMIADGKSEIDNIELIDRGYEDVDERLRSLGARIRRMNGTA